MNTAPATQPPALTAQDLAAAKHERQAQAAEPAWQQALDRAGPQGQQRRLKDELVSVSDSPLAAFADLGPAPFAGQQAPQNLTLAVPSRNPVADAGNTAVAPAGASSAAHPAIQRASVAASLSSLQMPASAEGVQHWQFSFSQAGAPLAGVTLTAPVGAPWQMQVQLPAHARERTALETRLGELRHRLAERGSAISDIAIEAVMQGDTNGGGQR